MTDEQVAKTAAGDVVLPVKNVSLTSKALRRPGGAPLVVRCEFLEEDELLKLIEAAPGHSPELGIKKDRTNIETARGLLKYAPGLIGAGCVLIGEDGSEQRPGFYFGPDPKDGSLPGRFLSTPDKLRLLMSVLEVSGFVGGPADKMRFPDGERAGSEAGERTVDTGEGHGDAPGGTPTREGEIEPAPADAGAGV